MAATSVLGDFGMTLDEVKAGVSLYPEEVERQEYIWLFGYAVATLRTWERLCQELGYDRTVVQKVWQGKYEARHKFREAAQRLRRRADLARGTEFIETEVTRRIWRACDLARDTGAVVHICGGTGRSKSTAVREWAVLNNHGRSIYLDLPVPCSLRRLADALAPHCGRRTDWRKSAAVFEQIEASLDRSNVLILDEATRLLPAGRGRDVRALEWLRRLHDVRGVGLVLVATDVFRDEMERGAISAYLEQLLGRIEERVLIPAKVLRAEVREVVSTFTPEPSGELLAAVAAYTNSGKGSLRTSIRLLRQSALLAEKKGEPLSVGHWATAVKLRETSQVWSE